MQSVFVHIDCALVRMQIPKQQVDERGFAGATVPDNGGELARRKGTVYFHQGGLFLSRIRIT